MKFAYKLLWVKDLADAIWEWWLPPMIVAGSVGVLATIVSWLAGWSVEVVIVSFCGFAVIALGLAVVLVIGALADIMITILGHTEVELEERRLA